jgi:NAD(P)-dependent dehydrogenase (short-subunit alcohol dehydrogenase family)
MADLTTAPFRPGLLEGTSLVLAPGDGTLARAVAELVRGLGARVEAINAAELLDEAAVVQAMEGVMRRAGPLGTVVVDAAALFDDGFRSALDGAWIVCRASATAGMIDAPQGGKIVLIGPRPGGGEHADAAAAGLENLARTLSAEWARHQIRPTMIAPGRETTSAEVASLVAYLASPAGDYYSGCRFSLGTTA